MPMHKIGRCMTWLVERYALCVAIVSPYNAISGTGLKWGRVSACRADSCVRVRANTLAGLEVKENMFS